MMESPEDAPGKDIPPARARSGPTPQLGSPTVATRFTGARDLIFPNQRYLSTYLPEVPVSGLCLIGMEFSGGGRPVDSCLSGSRAGLKRAGHSPDNLPDKIPMLGDIRPKTCPMDAQTVA